MTTWLKPWSERRYWNIVMRRRVVIVIFLASVGSSSLSTHCPGARIQPTDTADGIIRPLMDSETKVTIMACITPRFPWSHYCLGKIAVAVNRSAAMDTMGIHPTQNWLNDSEKNDYMGIDQHHIKQGRTKKIFIKATLAYMKSYLTCQGAKEMLK